MSTATTWVEELSPTTAIETTVRQARGVVATIDRRGWSSEVTITLSSGEALPPVRSAELFGPEATAAVLEGLPEPKRIEPGTEVWGTWVEQGETRTWVLDATRHALAVTAAERRPSAVATIHTTPESEGLIWITASPDHVADSDAEVQAYWIETAAAEDRAGLTRVLADAGLVQNGPWRRVGEWLIATVLPAWDWESSARSAQPGRHASMW